MFGIHNIDEKLVKVTLNINNTNRTLYITFVLPHG